MEWFNVKVKLTQESVFTVNVEADSCEDAEQMVKDSVWEDEYTDWIRSTLEITDEEYDADEWCMECDRPIDYCECEGDEDESE
jgi:hypothetical protein